MALMGGGSTLRIRTVVTLATKQFINSIGQLEHRTTRFQAFLKRSSMAMGAGSLAIAAGLGMAVKQAAKFEQNLANMQSVAKASGSEFKKLRKLALDMGKTTRKSAIDSADAMYSLASAGQKYGQIVETLPGVIQLATATQYDLAQTTETVVATLNSFGYEADQTDRIVNVFAATIGNTLGRMEKLQYSMKLLGPTAKHAGLEIEGTAAALGVLYNAGLDGSSAGAALRRVLSALLNPSQTLTNRITKLNMSISDIDPRMYSLAEIMVKLKKAGLDARAAFQDFGLRGAAALLALLDAGEGLTQLEWDITGTTAAATMAEIQMNTLQGSLDHLKNVINVFAIEVGTTLVPAIKQFADATADMTERAAGASPHMIRLGTEATTLAAIWMALAAWVGIAGQALGALGVVMVQAGGVIAAWVIALRLGLAKSREGFDKMAEAVADNNTVMAEFYKWQGLIFGFMFNKTKVAEDFAEALRKIAVNYRDIALAAAEPGAGAETGFRLWQGPEVGPRVEPTPPEAPTIAERMAAVQAPLLEVDNMLRTLNTDTMDWAASLAEGTTIFEQFGVSGVEAAGYVLDAWRKMTEGQRVALDQNLQMFNALSGRMAQAYKQFYGVTKKFGKAVLNSLYQGFVGMLSMVVDKAIAEILIEQAKTLGLLTISGFLNPANWIKIAPMLAAAAAASAAISALGTIHPKYHEGGLPSGLNQEMPVVIRPRREGIVDLFKAQRGGFGHTMVPALAGGGEYNMTFNLNFGSTAPADVDWLDVTENLALKVREAMMGD